MNAQNKTEEKAWPFSFKPGSVEIAVVKNIWEDGSIMNNFNKRISKWLESSRLSTASSVSSNERMSTVSVSDGGTSGSADSDSAERPVSLASTLSLESSRDGQSLYGSTGVLLTNISEPVIGESNVIYLEHASKPEMELHDWMMGVGEAQHETSVSPRANNSYNNNNHLCNRGSMENSSRTAPVSPFAAKAMAPNPQLSYVDRVVVEIIETERMYVQDLLSIVEDYLAHIIDTPDLPIRAEQVSALFGNIEDIYEFNSELLQALDMCENDPVAIAQCFVDKRYDFDIYTQYCTNYPNSVAALTECMRNKILAKFFRERQASLKRSLPLGSYLLKPVQRILKYHLLLQEIAKHFDSQEKGYDVVEEAIDSMTGVAWYINDMKRKHEHAVRLQEVQSLLINWKGPDLTTYGELVLESTFRLHRAKNERTLFLFDKILLITKKRGEHYVYKTHISCSTLMMTEKAKDSLTFSVMHYKRPKQPFTLQARTIEEKKLWTHHIKRLILENHQALIPQKAKEAILEINSIYPSKYKYSPERLKKSWSSDFPEDGRAANQKGRRQSDPPKHILPTVKAVLKHADSEGSLETTMGILHSGGSASTLCSSLGDTEIERPSVEEEEEEEDEEGADCEEMSFSKESLDHLNPSEEPRLRPLGSACKAEEAESDEDEILLGDDQAEDGSDQSEGSHFMGQNNVPCDKGKLYGDSESRSLTDQIPAESEQALDRESSVKNMTGVLDEAHPADTERTDKPVLLSPTEHPNFVPYDLEELPESTPFDPVEETKSGSESSEDEEAGSEHEPNYILPPSVLDKAGAIAERFLTSLSRRGSVILDDCRSVGCSSPRLTSRSNSALSLEAIERAQRHISTSSEPTSTLVCQDVTALKAASSQENMLSLSPTSDNLFGFDKSINRRRDSTLSRSDRLLINKIKTYYEHAENQDASFSIRRRESLSYIPAGMVRNSVCRFNNIPKEDPPSEPVIQKAEDSTAKSTSNPISRPSSWTESSHSDFTKELPCKVVSREKDDAKILKNNDTEPYFNEGKSREPDSNENFYSSSDMIKVWEEMEREINGTERGVSQNNVPLDVCGPGSFNSHLPYKNSHLEYSEPLTICEESDLSTITEESSEKSPTKTFQRESERHVGRTSRAPVPRIICLPSSMENEMLLQDMDKVKNKVFQLARQFSQKIKGTKPIVTQRASRNMESLLQGRNLASVQEEKPDTRRKGKPNLTLTVPSYNQVILQELTSPPLCKSPSPDYSGNQSPAQAADVCVGGPCASPLNRGSSKSLISPCQAEMFSWPDVQELRSMYNKRGSSNAQPKMHWVGRSCSVPEKMLAHSGEFLESARPTCGFRFNAPTQMRDRTCSTSAADSHAYTSSQGESHSHGRICRTGSLDQHFSGQQLESLQNLSSRGHCCKNTFYTSGESNLPRDKKLIVIEKMAENDLPADFPEEEEEQNVDDESFVQIRSPTTREKISIRAVIERCKAYQDSDEYHQRQQEAEKAVLSNNHNIEFRKCSSAKKSEAHQQSLVKNLREKFQNLSSNT
ncbi:pleckstrin homology domain-containing family G member 3 isoform X2 [Polypterus senegalus]|uniref:pleckstrin homology domain-containing family G member 3 isoform X2 n=1 Tax=Polypterus senegalus TaxID=55291 RepID=UPI001963B549|nr:pleckstrin homology domain-containing family G member 3 isoform X2 [Polypterus senegalus]